MGTQQALTTKQLEVLLVLNVIEEEVKNNEIVTEVTDEIRKKRKELFDKVAWDLMYIKTLEIPDENAPELIEEMDELCALHYYGYINKYRDLTRDGKQYIALFMEDLEMKMKNPSIVINNQFTLINIEQLNAGINTLVDIAGNSEIFSKATEGVKKLLHSIKNMVNK